MTSAVDEPLLKHLCSPELFSLSCEALYAWRKFLSAAASQAASWHGALTSPCAA